MGSRKIKLLVIGVILICLVLPGFRPTKAFHNIKSFLTLRSNVKNITNEYSQSETNITEYWKRMSELRDSDLDVLSPKALYNKITTLDGVKESSARVVSISQGNIKPLNTFDPESNDTQIDGIEITVYVEDISTFIGQISSLNLAYESFNLIYPEKKFTIVFNTKGGL